jgi:DNA replication licensing factor MCM7
MKKFLLDFETPLPGQPRGHPKYAFALAEIKAKKRRVLDVELDDVALTMDQAFLRSVEGNTVRYLELFYQAVDDILMEDRREAPEEFAEDDGVDAMLRAHRVGQHAEILREGGEEPADKRELLKMFPAQLLRLYELRIVPRTTEKPLSLRQVAGSSLGRLVQIQAMVLRATDVRPMMQVATYSWCVAGSVLPPLTAPPPRPHYPPSLSAPFHPPPPSTHTHTLNFLSDKCGFELYQPITGRTFMPLSTCTSSTCVANEVAGRIHMSTKRSRFVKYQELKVQELPEHVPVGCIPRSMTVLCKGESTRQCKAGEVVVLGGVFLPTPYTGFQAVKAGLTTDTYLDVQSVTCLKRGEAGAMDADTERLITEVAESPDAYSNLARSIAPEIFGLDDVKKVLLLQMIGGVTRQQGDGMKTRGDINVCLMGDPGVAKSQLLKHISKVAPRCVYTTGKGSSGVGLTASVVRDAMTGEITLEGGALVLADKGICCIDEFDKMEETDRTAIHEVMEQQTVSIAKAGITTQLNARTAILAAANPRYGRYNRLADRDAHTALQKNINLPAALLSRFDLMFLLLDETDPDNDFNLAQHITHVHRHEEHPPLGFTPFQPIFLRQFITVVRTFEPTVPPELRDYIVEAYVDIRAKDKQRSLEANSRASTTARQLLSILRLAEAHCKLNFRNRVQQADVDEAIRLIQMSKASVMESDSDLARGARADPVSRIWALISPRLNVAPHFSAWLVRRAPTAPLSRAAARPAHAMRPAHPPPHTRTCARAVPFDEALQMAQRAGFLQDDFSRFLEDYESLNVIQVNATRTRIDLASSGL